MTAARRLVLFGAPALPGLPSHGAQGGGLLPRRGRLARIRWVSNALERRGADWRPRHSCRRCRPQLFAVSAPPIFPEASPNSAPMSMETNTRMRAFPRPADMSLSFVIASAV
jgi:hypothetical protein